MCPTTCALAISALLFAAPAFALADPDSESEAESEAEPEPELEPELDEVIELEGSAPAEAASSVHFGARQLRERPHHHPSDVLRQTPGLVVAQHAGGGKSDQYFLRGFDADHGTDVAVFVDGIPVNLTSHGHGQGYADAHWLIPETIASLDVHKGPYAARFGDFYTAGAIELSTFETAPESGLWLTGGTELAGPVSMRRPTARLVGMGSPHLREGSALLAAEISTTDGPVIDPQDFQRATALGRWRRPIGRGQVHAAVTLYTASWTQSGQVPAAEVAAGRLDRFGSLDPSEGGDATRWSLAGGWEHGSPVDGAWAIDAYLVRNRLQLFSDFTLYARDPVNGDQIEQNDDRYFGGASATYRKVHRAVAPGLFHAGLQVRADDTTADLWHSTMRRRLDDCFDVGNPCNRSKNRVVDLAAYVEEDVSIGSRLRLLGGVRADQYFWTVTDLDPETAGTMDTTSGTAQHAIISPKLSAIVRASDDLDVFVNSGFGFHSNDARAAVASDGEGALVRAIGAESGARLDVNDRLKASVALWYLHLASEQLWSGDSGGTVPSDPTRRYGLDLDWAWQASSWLWLDANLAVARSTFVANQGNGGALALAPRLMGGGGVTARRGSSFVALRTRGIGSRPANDDGSLTADGYLIFDIVAEHRVGRSTIGLTVDNLFDADWREAQFAEESRVSPSAAVREDVHFTPGVPLTALITVGMTL